MTSNQYNPFPGIATTRIMRATLTMICVLTTLLTFRLTSHVMSSSADGKGERGK